MENKKTKKEQIINNIKSLENRYMNEDQKNIAIKILLNTPEEEVQMVADFIYYKRNTGFAFDYSPEVAKGRLAILREDKDKRINVGDEVEDDENKLIIGDNYNALKNLLVTHENKIDVIYIDPPYNTESAKNDGNSSYKEGEANQLIYKNKFGRGGWLNMMKARLDLAKDLLSQDGVIFLAIDDDEQAYIKVLMDDIFGEENFVGTVPIRSQPNGRIIRGISRRHEYIIIYKKSFHRDFLYEKNDEIKKVNFLRGGDNSLAIERPKRFFPILIDKENILHLLPENEYIKIYNKKEKSFDEEFIKKINSLYSKDYKVIWPINLDKNIRKVWQRSFERTKNEINNIIFHNKNLKKIYSIQNEEVIFNSWMDKKEFSYSHHGAVILNSIIEKTKFRYPKSVNSIIHLLKSVKFDKKNIVILDFFAGSGTTGHAVLELNKEDGGNRKFILATNNENNIASEVTYERLFRIINGKGTNGDEKFPWLEKNQPYLNTKLRVIEIDDSIKIGLKDDVDDKIFEDAKKGLQLLDAKYNEKDLNLFYDLAALNPLKEEEDKF